MDDGLTMRGATRALGMRYIKLLAHLFLRKTGISVPVIFNVIDTLLLHAERASTQGLGREQPRYTLYGGYNIDWVVALFLECGHALEDDLKSWRIDGKPEASEHAIMDDFFSRLSSLQNSKSRKSREKNTPLLEKRTRSAISDLLELRKQGWKRKTAKQGDSGDVVEEIVGARPRD